MMFCFVRIGRTTKTGGQKIPRLVVVQLYHESQVGLNLAQVKRDSSTKEAAYIVVASKV